MYRLSSSSTAGDITPHEVTAVAGAGAGTGAVVNDPKQFQELLIEKTKTLSAANEVLKAEGKQLKPYTTFIPLYPKTPSVFSFKTSPITNTKSNQEFTFIL